MITETFYRNNNNDNSLEVLVDGATVDITGTTRMQLKIGTVIYDSAVHPNIFDWTTNGATGRLDLEIDPPSTGDPALPDPGTYKARLIIFDATYPQGKPWKEFIAVVED
jgi:hypothetical protein